MKLTNMNEELSGKEMVKAIQGYLKDASKKAKKIKNTAEMSLEELKRLDKIMGQLNQMNEQNTHNYQATLHLEHR